MPGKATRVYPVKGRFLMDVPARVTLVATKGEADDLIASGAFTDNPRDPNRDDAAPDDTGDEPVSPARTGMFGEDADESKE